MKIVAVTAEFNPLHNGHLRLLNEARRLAPDLLLVILNGNVTQRGELAVLDKYTRAKHALLAGADAVVELPTVHGAACAERFADAAIKILSHIPAEERVLLFGSEDGDLARLTNAAKLLSDEPMEISVDLKELMDMGFSYPSARAQAFAQYTSERKIPVADLTKPNNILAIEYVRSILKRGGVTPCTIKRTGDYKEEEIDVNAPSAQGIRRAMAEGNLAAAKKALPSYVFEDLKTARGANGFSPILFYHISETTAEDLSRIADVTEGIENRILRLAKDHLDAESLVQAVTTKRYTASRVRRILVNALLRVDKEIFENAIDEAPYYKVLGIKKDRTDVLSLLSHAGALLTGEAEAKESGIPSAVIDQRAHELYRAATGTETEDGMLLL